MDEIESRLKSLIYFNNSHFMMNMFNNMQTDVLKNDVTSYLKLSSLVHKLIKQANDMALSPYISLKKEKQFLESYFESESIRFNLKNELTIDFKIENQDICIPNFIIQPILEHLILELRQNQEDLPIKIQLSEKQIDIVSEIANSDYKTKDMTSHSETYEHAIQRIELFDFQINKSLSNNQYSQTINLK